MIKCKYIIYFKYFVMVFNDDLYDSFSFNGM